jgi:hypothetical protein
MAAIVTKDFRHNNALQFFESWSETNKTTYYLFVGRPQPFSATTGGGTDAAPPTPLDNIEEPYAYYRDMQSAKLLLTGDRVYAIPRHNWTTGTVYDMYRADYGATVNAAVVQTAAGGIDMWATGTQMYVLNSANNVYKCMNNNAGGTSTTEPTGTSTSEFTTADSYVWKYMYTLSTTQITNFLTTDFMAVATNSTVSAAAVPGSVSQYIVANGGAGYTNGTYSAETLRGDGTGGTFTVLVASGAVSTVTAVAVGGGSTRAAQYMFADCNIDGISGIGTPSTSAIVVPVLSPPGGNGSNAVEELGGFYIMTNTTIAGTAGSGDFVVDQDFRRIAVLKDPYNYGTTTISTADTMNALKSVTFAASPTPGTFVNDEVITGGTSGAKGLVVDWESSTRVLKYIQTQWTGIDGNKDIKAFAASEVVTGAGGATGTVSAVTNPEIDYYSGQVIYAENRAPITRAADQTENIKLIIEF